MILHSIINFRVISLIFFRTCFIVPHKWRMYFIRSETANNSTLGAAVSSLPCTSKNKRTVASAKSAYKSAERAGATNCHSFLLSRHKFSIFPFPLAVGFTRRHYLARWTQQWQWQKIEILTIFPVRHGDRHKGTPKTTRGNTRCSTDAGVCIGLPRLSSGAIFIESRF